MEYEVSINGGSIIDWESFHNEFQKKLGFFEGYERSLDAWINCMSDLYTNGEYKSLTNFNLNDGDKLILNILNVDVWKKVSLKTFEGFIDCCIEANSARMNFYMVIK